MSDEPKEMDPENVPVIVPINKRPSTVPGNSQKAPEYVSSEAEFEQWLASTLESERQRLRERAAGQSGEPESSSRLEKSPETSRDQL